MGSFVADTIYMNILAWKRPDQSGRALNFRTCEWVHENVRPKKDRGGALVLRSAAPTRRLKGDRRRSANAGQEPLDRTMEIH